MPRAGQCKARQRINHGVVSGVSRIRMVTFGKLCGSPHLLADATQANRKHGVAPEVGAISFRRVLPGPIYGVCRKGKGGKVVRYRPNGAPSGGTGPPL